MRRGFSLITAIMFIVLVATIGALALSFSTQTVKQTTDLYLRTQAELLAYSATEYALLAISGHDRANGCLKKISATHGEFSIDVNMRYIGVNLPADCNTLANGILTAESDITVLVDTIVSATINEQSIRFHRRTLQKP